MFVCKNLFLYLEKKREKTSFSQPKKDGYAKFCIAYIQVIANAKTADNDTDCFDFVDKQTSETWTNFQDLIQ